jgi:hypothetical protein
VSKHSQPPRPATPPLQMPRRALRGLCRSSVRRASP